MDNQLEDFAALSLDPRARQQGGGAANDELDQGLLSEGGARPNGTSAKQIKPSSSAIDSPPIIDYSRRANKQSISPPLHPPHSSSSPASEPTPLPPAPLSRPVLPSVEDKHQSDLSITGFVKSTRGPNSPIKLTKPFLGARPSPEEAPRKLRRKSIASSATSSPPTSPRMTVEPLKDPKDSRRRSGIGSKGAPYQDSKQTPSQSPPPVTSRRASNAGVVSAPLDASALTPQDRHYLNRICVNLEIQREISALAVIGTLSRYGEPFVPHANGPNSRPADATSTASGGGMFSFLTGSGGGAVARPKRAGWDDYEWKESSVSDSPVLSYLFYRFILNLPALRDAQSDYWTDQIQPFWDSFAERDLSATNERFEVTKRRLLSMGFTRIIGTYYSTCYRASGEAEPARPSIAVMRRIEQLVPGSMDSQWNTSFPGEAVAYNAWTAIVDEKEVNGIKTFSIVSTVVVVETKPTCLVSHSWFAIQRLAASLDPQRLLSLPPLPNSSNTQQVIPTPHLQRWLRSIVIALSHPPAELADSPAVTEARQKLETFLLGEPEKASTRELEEWVRKGKEEEASAERKRQKWVAIGKRAKKLRTTWALYRGALVAGDEIDKSIALVRKTPTIAALPESHRDAQEWARIWVAYALHYLFVSSSHAPEILNIVKSFHALIPYGPLKLGLSLVNPTLAIRAIVSIMLGQPAGQPSLFQRIFGIVCSGGIKAQKAQADALKKRIGDEGLSRAVEAHVYAPFTQRSATRDASAANGEDILLTIVRDHGTEPDQSTIRTLHQQFSKQGEPAQGTIHDLRLLLAALCRKRDREQVLEIVMEPNTPRLLHASIAVFYDTIHAVANASNLAARLGDLQAFLDDLVKTSFSDHKEPSDFINLAKRHEQNLYFFVHELASNNTSLLDPIIAWCKSGLEFIKEGIPTSGPAPDSPQRAGVNYDTLLSSRLTGAAERQAVLDEVRSLARWTSYRKAQADIQLRIDLLRASASSEEEVSCADTLDADAVYEDLLSQDGALVADGQLERREEGSLEWAWFGEDEGGLLRRTVKQRKADGDTAPLEKIKSRGSLFRTTSSKSAQHGNMDDGFVVVDESAQGPKLKLRQPSVEHVRKLLKPYQRVAEGALHAARDQSIK